MLVAVNGTLAVGLSDAVADQTHVWIRLHRN